jgi:hypothetical protein
VALLIFNQNVVFFSDFTSDRGAVKQIIGRINAGGDTALYQATNDAILKAASAPLPRKAVVLMTDGENYDPHGGATRDGALDVARRSGIPVYGIGLGTDADFSYLNDLAQASRGQAQQAPSPADLDQLYRSIGDALRGQYVIRARPGPVQRAPSHTVRLTVSFNGAQPGDEASFPGTGLTLLPDPTPAPTASPATAPTPVPTPAPTVAPPVAVAAPRARGRRPIVPLVIVAGVVALAAAGWWLMRRRRRRREEPVPGFQVVLERRGEEIAPPPPAEQPPLPVPPGPLPASPAAAALHVASGPLAGLKVPVADAPVTIGTGRDCRVVLPAGDASVERRHARVWHREGRYMLHRLARQGTVIVGEQPVEWAVLEPGDEFVIGPHHFRFQLTATNGASAATGQGSDHGR